VRHYISSNGKKTNEYWFGKDAVGRGRSLILGERPGIFLEELRKTTNAYSQVSRCSGEIRTGHLPSTRLNRYHFSHPAR
jgi:hypothetical protein